MFTFLRCFRFWQFDHQGWECSLGLRKEFLNCSRIPCLWVFERSSRFVWKDLGTATEFWGSHVRFLPPWVWCGWCACPLWACTPRRIRARRGRSSYWLSRSTLGEWHWWTPALTLCGCSCCARCPWSCQAHSGGGFCPETGKTSRTCNSAQL